MRNHIIFLLLKSPKKRNRVWCKSTFFENQNCTIFERHRKYESFSFYSFVLISGPNEPKCNLQRREVQEMKANKSLFAFCITKANNTFLCILDTFLGFSTYLNTFLYWDIWKHFCIETFEDMFQIQMCILDTCL